MQLVSRYSRAALLGGGLLIAGAGAMLSQPGEAAPAPAKKFPHATGRVVYKLSNQMMNGTSTLTWSNYGGKVRQDLAAKMNAQGRSMDLKTWVISDGKVFYSHNPIMGNVVSRMKLSPEQLAKQANAGMPMMAAPKGLGKPIGKATVAGKPCTIHTVPQAKGARMWVWQNMPLKMEMALGQAGSMKMEATRVETGIPLSPAIFEVPKGMQVRDVEMPKGPAPAAKKP